MSFRFGTNGPGFMEKAGNIADLLPGYEVLTACLLDATFLDVMLFRRRRHRAPDRGAKKARLRGLLSNLAD